MFGEVVGALCSQRDTTSAPKRLSSNSNISTSAESEEAAPLLRSLRFGVWEVRYHHLSLEIAGNMPSQLSEKMETTLKSRALKYLLVAITRGYQFIT